MRTLTVSSLYRQSGEPHNRRECVVPSMAPVNLKNMPVFNSRHFGAGFGRALIHANFLLNRRLALEFCSEQRVEVRRD
jgi:hypothetical protein